MWVLATAPQRPPRLVSVCECDQIPIASAAITTPIARVTRAMGVVMAAAFLCVLAAAPQRPPRPISVCDQIARHLLGRWESLWQPFFSGSSRWLLRDHRSPGECGEVTRYRIMCVATWAHQRKGGGGGGGEEEGGMGGAGGERRCATSRGEMQRADGEVQRAEGTERRVAFLRLDSYNAYRPRNWTTFSGCTAARTRWRRIFLSEGAIVRMAAEVGG